MFAFVEGLLEDFEIDSCVVDVGGFGVNVNISGRTFSALPGLGEHIKLYTYTSVREDALSLYGFLDKDDLSVFKKLITVNGIGPKGALSLLSIMDAQQLRCAITSGDSKAIAQAPGIGKKTAERIILDLKDKLPATDEMLVRQFSKQTSGVQLNLANEQISQTLSPAMQDAIDAMTALGFSLNDSKKAVLSIENADTMDSSELLSAAMKKAY